ncbi:unnamed protein product, partial [marine sediment metagenome]
MRDLSVAFQTALDQTGTRFSNLLKIQAADGRLIGITNFNKEIEFNDGTLLTYYPAMNDSALQTGANLEVDTAEAMVLLDVAGTFTENEIEAGLLDVGKFWWYRVNRDDLTSGFAVLDFGTTGITKTRDNLSGIIELRGESQKLKQNFVKQYSKTCRAVFGSSEGEDLFPCNFNALSIRVNGVVDSVDIDEPDQIFTGTFPPSIGPFGPLPFAPGLIGFLTGNNAGLITEIEIEDAGTVSLTYPTAYAIQVG